MDPPTKTTSSCVDGAVLEPSTAGTDGGQMSKSTVAGEEGETQSILSRQSFSVSAPEPTSGGGTELTEGRERDQEEHGLGLRRVYLGSNVEATKACKEDLISILENMDELELAVHQTQSHYLHCLEGYVQDAEWSEFLSNSRSDELEARESKACASGREDGGQVDTWPDTTTMTRPAESNGSRVAAAVWTKRDRQRAPRVGLSAAEKTSSRRSSSPAHDPVASSWESEGRDVESTREALEMVQPIGARQWRDHYERSGFTGLGYGTTVTQYEASRAALSRDYGESVRLSGGRLRQLRRELRAVKCEELRLGFAAFGKGASPESILLSDDVYSAVDSGTSVTIAQLAHQLAGFDKSATIRIMGFNGNVSRSGGKGRMIGVALNRQGERVVVRVPNAHHIAGAPSDLLSVSALVACGYEFHFTKSGAWIVTPEMDIVDLEQRGGLYWLKWTKTVDPLQTKLLDMPTASPKPVSASASHSDDAPASVAPPGGGSAATGGEAPSSADPSMGTVEETDETLSELGIVESPDQGAAQIELGWAQGAAPLSSACSHTSCEVCCSIVREREKYVPLDLLHRRLAHFDHSLCDKMVSQRSLDVRLLDHHASTCNSCKANKLTRGAVPKQREDEAAQRKPFERVWTDVKGKC